MKTAEEYCRDGNNDINPDRRMDKLTASEALYGFGGWLTSRTEPVTFSGLHDAAPMAELINEFCKANQLQAPRDDWSVNLIHPPKETKP